MSNYNSKQDQKSPAKRFLFILGVLFFVLYFVIGIAVIFWKDFPIELDLPYRIAFGILLIVYAFFRFVRLLKAKD
ncbi:MAG TPA: hypothetical protein VNI52_09265 [Sphingobacteriaceae bacterium]|nr:hypothetical protein [Sphingobacteriaceae bacterium]